MKTWKYISMVITVMSASGNLASAHSRNLPEELICYSGAVDSNFQLNIKKIGEREVGGSVFEVSSETFYGFSTSAKGSLLLIDHNELRILGERKISNLSQSTVYKLIASQTNRWIFEYSREAFSDGSQGGQTAIRERLTCSSLK